MATRIPTTVRSLRSADKALYAAEGYLVVENLFDAKLVDTIRHEISRIVAKHPDVPEELVQMEPGVRNGDVVPATKELGVRKLSRMSLHNTTFRELAFHPAMKAIATELLGPDVKLMQSMLLMKPPHLGGVKVWHQDNAYFRLDPNHVLGIWVACDATDAANGCMHVIPGSHLDGTQAHGGHGDDYGLVDPPSFDSAMAVPLQPGDALLFHGDLHHGTPANETKTRRRALQYHYVSSACRSTVEPGRKAELLVSGGEFDDCI